MDRTQLSQPPLFSINTASMPLVEKIFLSNSIPLYIIETGTEEIMRIEFIFRAGQVYEYLPLLATTTNMMLTEGSEKYDAKQLNSTLDFYGAFLNLSAEKDTSGLVIYFLTRHLSKILGLCREILFRPLFPDKELDLLLKKRLKWFLVSREKVNSLSSDKFFESVFGNHHPYGRQVQITDFENITSGILKDFHSMYYTPENMVVFISGRVHPDTAKMMDHYFGGLGTRSIYIEDTGNHIKGESEKKAHVNKPGALQSSIRIGSITINKRHPDYPGLKILNVILGGYFGSRLMKNIREEKGYTYGIHSAVTSLGLAGYKVISTEVSHENARRVIDEIYREINLLKKRPAGDTELAVVKNYMSGEMVRMFDGPFAIAESLKAVWEFGLDFGYYQRLSERIRTITPDEIISLAHTYYNIDDLYEITAG